jgi:threonine synthase
MARPVDLLPPVTANPAWLGYRCMVCDREFASDHEGFVCSECGIDGILDVVYDHGKVSGAGGVLAPDLGGLWRFAPVLPLAPAADHPAWSCGDTPVHDAGRLAAHLGLAALILKDDTGLPSASLKDRASAVAVARARQLGIDHLACASTGNAAASLAVLAARAGLRCTIYVPASVPRAKLAQLHLHGAQVVEVNGSYDQTFTQSLEEIDRNQWYSRNCAHNALLVEGKKTAALELAAALTNGFTTGDRDLPDAIFVPVGDGCIVSSVVKGFQELRTTGAIGKIPRVIGVQATGAAPLAQAWALAGNAAANMSGKEILAAIKPQEAVTFADSIRVGIPRNRVKAWKYVAGTGGGFVSVDDEMIAEAIGLLARLAGVWAEPSGAAGLAGVRAALGQGLISGTEKIAVMVTGHGLKDPGAGLVKQGG